ncbi:uncharacterized protein LOC144344805 [Saccoglossus kowalevskii]
MASAAYTDDQKLIDNFKKYPNLFKLKLEEEWEAEHISRHMKKVYDKLQREKDNEPSDVHDESRRDNLLTFLAIKLERFSKARGLIREIRNRDPDNLINMTNEGFSLVKQERLTDATAVLNKIEEFLDALRHGDKEVKIRQIIGQAELPYSYSRLGPRYHKYAIQSFKSILDEAEKHDVPEEYIMMWRYGLSLVYVRSLNPFNYCEDEQFDATSYYRNIIDLLYYGNIHSGGSQNFTGKSWVKLGEAATKYQVIPQNKKSEIPVNLPDRLSVIDCYMHGLRTSPEDHCVLTSTGRYLRQVEKNFDEAEKYLKKSVDKLPTVAAYHHLGLTYRDKWKESIRRERFHKERSWRGQGARYNTRGQRRPYRGPQHSICQQDRPHEAQVQFHPSSWHQSRRGRGRVRKQFREKGGDRRDRINPEYKGNYGIKADSRTYQVDRHIYYHSQPVNNNNQSHNDNELILNQTIHRMGNLSIDNGSEIYQRGACGGSDNSTFGHDSAGGEYYKQGTDNVDRRIHERDIPTKKYQPRQDNYGRRKRFPPKPHRKHYLERNAENPIDPGNQLLLEAKKYFLEANKLARGTASVILQDLARIKLSLDEDFEEAVDYFRLAVGPAIISSPLDKSKIYEQWGMCLLQHGKEEDGKNLLRKAIECAAKVKEHAKIAFPTLEEILLGEKQRRQSDTDMCKELIHLYHLIESYSEVLDLSYEAYNRDQNNEKMLVENLNKHGGCSSRILQIFLQQNGHAITPETIHRIRLSTIEEQTVIAVDLPRDIFQETFAETFNLPDGDYEHDILLLNCEEDNNLAHALLTVIEEYWGLDCCFPKRDFDEDANFESECGKSTKICCCVIALLSHQFLKKYQFILNSSIDLIKGRQKGKVILCISEEQLVLEEELKCNPQVNCSHLKEFQLNISDDYKTLGMLCKIRDNMFLALCDSSNN